MKTYEMKLKELELIEEGNLITIDTGIVGKYIKHTANTITYEDIQTRRIKKSPVETLFKTGVKFTNPSETRSNKWVKMERTSHKRFDENKCNFDDFIVRTVLIDDIICKFGEEKFNKIKNNDDVNELFNFIKYGISLPNPIRSLFIEMLQGIVNEFKFFTNVEPDDTQRHEIKNLFYNFLLDKNPTIASRMFRNTVLLGTKPYYIYYEKNRKDISTEKTNSYSLNRSMEFIYNIYLQNNEFYPFLLKNVLNRLTFKKQN